MPLSDPRVIVTYVLNAKYIIIHVDLPDHPTVYRVTAQVVD